MEAKAANSGARKQYINKKILAAGLIVCYIAGLSIVSYVRAPERYQRAAEPVIEISDFEMNSGEPLIIDETGIQMKNTTIGAPAVLQTDIELCGLDRIWVTYQVNCPEAFQGGILHTDLFNEIECYDAPEQEHILVLQPGVNFADFVIYPGENHPETAKFRFFTLELADYEMAGVKIYAEKLQPRVPGGLLLGAGLIFVGTFLILVTVYVKGRKR